MLPKVLENNIVSILNSHSVLNWSIFGETDGNVSLKIRFQINSEGSEGQGADIQHMSYKRKTEKQVNRDRQRVKKRKLSENSVESVRRGDSSFIQDNVLENSPCNFEPTCNHLPPEILQHSLNLENLETTDSTLSDSSSEVSLNSTACAANDNFNVPDDLFLIKHYAESPNSVSKPDADPVNYIPKTDAERSFTDWLNSIADLDPIEKTRLRNNILEYAERRKRHPDYRPNRSMDT